MWPDFSWSPFQFALHSLKAFSEARHHVTWLAKTHECGLALPEQTRIVQETEKKRLASVFGVMPVNRVVHTGQGSSTKTKLRRGCNPGGPHEERKHLYGATAWWMTGRVLQDGTEGR